MKNANGFFYIRKLNNVHTCGVEVRTMTHSRMSSDLVADLIVEGVRNNPLTRPVHVVQDFKLGYGLRVSYRQAWLGVEKAKCEIFGDYLMSFDQLRWYVDVAKSCNPGSYIEFECDDDTKRFKRLFVSFHGSISGFDYCRPLLFLDGTFLKGRFRGNLLAATRKDGNQGFFPVCFAVVGSENRDNWHWFLEHLSRIVSPERNITFVSDRNLGLVEVLPKVFPMAFYAYCLYHLKMNLRHYLRGMFHGLKEKLITLFGKCAYAPTEETFHQCLVELKIEDGSRVEKFLDDIPYDHWSNAYFRGQHFGEMWSNIAESFNSWIREERHLPITKLIDSVRIKLMRKIAKRRELVNKWNDCNVDGDSEVVLPPLSKKQPGRPNKKRIRSNGEKVRQITCSRYGKVGNHNTKSCKEAL
ncbi:uncharacterized protein LOC114283543 [Camellia sinensis]|uniref:uncharacterized protein LOC114283543 n=1 Tax=Camellia sinensis TaxID=4442 RepID=UPI001035975D|nr:uncharacterized protein LOC114283543 [Camellia sinensis]